MKKKNFGKEISSSYIPRWFKSLDWEEVYYKQLKPPIVPKVSLSNLKQMLLLVRSYLVV